MPVVNRALRALMITEPARPNILRYAGALMVDETGAACSTIGPNGQAAPTGLTVGIPLVESRDPGGAEAIRWVPVMEEIRAAQDAACPARGPFSLLYVSAADECGALDTDPMPDRGLAAVRINYPYQAATLSGYQSTPSDIDPIPPNIANFITADDGAVQQLNDPPGGLLDDGAIGPYAGQYGLGRQLALAGRTASSVSQTDFRAGHLQARGSRMSPVSPRRPGGVMNMAPSTGATIIVAIVVVVVIVFVGVPRLRSQEPSTAGLIAVPTAATAIPAHTRVKRDHLWDRANTRIAVVYLPPRAVTKEMLLNISDIIGRVLDGDKQPGYVFTEDDFLPRGTREGLVAGIPTGKRAIRISADRVDGIQGLNAGDRFDIVATLPIDAANGGGSTPNFAGPYSPELQLQAALSNWDKQATVRVIVQNASIVEPMMTRGLATIQGGPGAAARTRPSRRR